MNEMGPFGPTDHVHLLRRENSYYRRFTTQLERDLYRAQESLELANREARRYRVQQRLRHDLSVFAATSASLTALCRRVADAVVEHTLCARVLVLNELEPGSQLFELRAAVGIDPASMSNQVRLESAIPFGFAASGRDHPPEAAEFLSRLEGFVGLRNILWIYDADAGFAIVMANAPGLATLAFQADDEDLASIALEGLLEGIWRLRSHQRRSEEAPTAPLLNASSETVSSLGVPRAMTPLTMNRHLGTVQETEITSDVQRGKSVSDVLLVEWTAGDFALFLVPGGSAGFQLLRKFRGRGNRRFRDLMAAVRFIRHTCDFGRPITIYAQTDPNVTELVAFALSVADLVGDNDTAAA